MQPETLDTRAGIPIRKVPLLTYEYLSSYVVLKDNQLRKHKL